MDPPDGFAQNQRVFDFSIETLDGIQGNLREALMGIMYARVLLGHFLRLGEDGFRQWVQNLSPDIEDANLNALCLCLREWIRRHLQVRGDTVLEFNKFIGEGVGALARL